MTQDRELRRGTLEMLLLRILADGHSYGYDLATQLSDRSAGQFGIKEGTLYPVLYRLDDAGFIEAEWSRPERGVPRKYYRLTTAGKNRLAELQGGWKQFSATINQVLESHREEQS